EGGACFHALGDFELADGAEEFVDGADVRGVAVALGDGPGAVLLGEGDGFFRAFDFDGGDGFRREGSEERLSGAALGGGVRSAFRTGLDGGDGGSQAEGDGPENDDLTFVHGDWGINGVLKKGWMFGKSAGAGGGAALEEEADA